MTIIAFCSLALAILTSSLRWRQRAWPSLLAGLLALSTAALAGVLTGPALLVALLLGLLTQWQPASSIDTSGRWPVRFVYWALLTVLSLALALHLLPGSNNPLLVDKLQLAADTVPYTLYANFDKGWAGYCLLLALSAGQSPHRRPFWQLLAAAALLIALTLSLALGLGLIRFDPKWPLFLPQFIFCNLLLTCVAEEALFRGVLQQSLTRQCEQRGYSWYWALLLASLLFGLAHLSGGWAYVLVATVAGVGYGWLYRQSGRLWPAILLHFGLNLSHLLLFSYPMLLSAFAAT